MTKGAFFELVQMETDALLEEVFGYTSRRNYEFWFNEPFEVGVLRQFRAVLGVIGFAAAHCPFCRGGVGSPPCGRP